MKTNTGVFLAAVVLLSGSAARAAGAKAAKAEALIAELERALAGF